MQKEKGSMPQKVDSRAKKPRRKRSDASWPAASDSTFIGQQVHGVLDGSFDAGYLLTVRVGDSQTVLRGLVFEPSLSVPLSKANDIAPFVDLTKREEQILPSAMHQPNPMASPVIGPSPVSGLTTITPPTLTHATAVATQSTPFVEYQAPPTAELGRASSGLAGHVTTELQGSSPKPVLTSQECSNTTSTADEPQQQAECS